MSDPKKPKNQPSGAYEVGYCKPPTAGQFKPGQSGNPKGKPKPMLTIEQMVAAELKKQTKVKVGGEAVMMAKKEALAKRIVADALTGDRHALRLALSLDAQAEARGAGEASEPLSEHEAALLMEMLRYPDDDD